MAIGGTTNTSQNLENLDIKLKKYLVTGATLTLVGVTFMLGFQFICFLVACGSLAGFYFYPEKAEKIFGQHKFLITGAAVFSLFGGPLGFLAGLAFGRLIDIYVNKTLDTIAMAQPYIQPVISTASWTVDKFKSLKACYQRAAAFLNWIIYEPEAPEVPPAQEVPAPENIAHVIPQNPQPTPLGNIVDGTRNIINAAATQANNIAGNIATGTLNAVTQVATQTNNVAGTIHDTIHQRLEEIPTLVSDAAQLAAQRTGTTNALNRVGNALNQGFDQANATIENIQTVIGQRVDTGIEVITHPIVTVKNVLTSPIPGAILNELDAEDEHPTPFFSNFNFIPFNRFLKQNAGIETQPIAQIPESKLNNNTPLSSPIEKTRGMQFTKEELEELEEVEDVEVKEVVEVVEDIEELPEEVVLDFSQPSSENVTMQSRVSLIYETFEKAEKETKRKKQLQEDKTLKELLKELDDLQATIFTPEELQRCKLQNSPSFKPLQNTKLKDSEKVEKNVAENTVSKRVTRLKKNQNSQQCGIQ